MKMPAATAEATSPIVVPVPDRAPLIVDMGKKRKKQIKQLREGRGKLLTAVNDVLEELRTAGTISASAQAVVIVVQQKTRKSRSPLWPLA
jgi:hypothetical protein